jgi:hypothetical protein
MTPLDVTLWGIVSSAPRIGGAVHVNEVGECHRQGPRPDALTGDDNAVIGGV